MSRDNDMREQPMDWVAYAPTDSKARNGERYHARVHPVTVSQIAAMGNAFSNRYAFRRGFK